MIDFDFTSDNEPHAGCLLVSEPFLADANFARSVIYLCGHDESGSWGFVLNNPIDKSFTELFPHIQQIDIDLGSGGPVDGLHLFFLHTQKDAFGEVMEVGNDIYIGGDLDLIRLHLDSFPDDKKHIRFFLGYSGWGPGQLTDEIKEKTWIVVSNFSTEVLFDRRDITLWQDILNKLGGKFRVMAGFPLNPNMN